MYFTVEFSAVKYNSRPGIYHFQNHCVSGMERFTLNSVDKDYLTRNLPRQFCCGYYSQIFGCYFFGDTEP